MAVNLINTAEAHFGAVRFVGFDPTNDKLISIGEDEGRLYIWNTEDFTQSTGTDIEQKTENNLVRTAVFQNDTTLIFGGDDRIITQTDWPNCKAYTTLIQSDAEIFFASSKWDTQTIAYSDQHLIQFHDLASNDYPTINNESEITWIGFSTNAKYFAFSCSDSTVVILDTNNYSEIYRKQFNIGAFHPMWGPADILLIPDCDNNGTIIILTASNLIQHPIKDQFTSTVVAGVLSNNFILALVDNSCLISFSRLDENFNVTPITTINYSGSDLTNLAFGNSLTNFFALGDSLGTLYLYQLILSTDQEPVDSSTIANEKEIEGVQQIESTPPPQTKQPEGKIKQSSLNSLLTGRSDFAPLKARKLAKKAKGKGKQQTLNLEAAPKSAPKKIESTRKFIRDNSDSEEEDDDEHEVEPSKPAKQVENTKSFLDNDGDVDVDINVPQSKEKNKKSFLDNDDDVDVDSNVLQSIEKNRPSFLDDDDVIIDNEQEELITKPKPAPQQFISDDGNEDEGNSTVQVQDDVPGYDDITLPDSDDGMAPALPDDDKVEDLNETYKSEFTRSLGSLDYSTSIRFMPNSYQNGISNSKILCWNSQGSIVMHSGGISYRDQYLEISPYGDSDFASKRIDDAYQVSIATVDKYGYVIATNETVVYHRHGDSGPDSDIIKSFSVVEIVQLVACGVSFFAVATANKNLHIFSASGFQLSVFALNGRLITMVGHENFLFVVSGKHHYELYDVFNRTLLASGILPIKAPLRYAGFNTYDHSVVIEGGNYQLLTLSYSNGIRWTPVADLSTHLGNAPNDVLSPFFIVEVFGNQVNGMNLEPASFDLSVSNDFPDTLEEIDFEAPTINSMLDDCIISILNYENSTDKEKDGRRFDRDLLRHQFSAALNDNRLLLAYQIACQLKTTKGLDAAIQICDQKGQTALSDRLYQLRTSRENEEEDDDESNNFELNEPYDEPEPFVRTEEIDEEEEQEEQSNAFLNKFKPVESEPRKDEEESEDEDKPVKVIPTKQSSDDDDDDLDNIEIPEPAKPSRPTSSSTSRKDVPNRPESRSTEKPQKKSAKPKKVASPVEVEEDNQNETNDQHDSDDVEVERIERRKPTKNKEEKKKPPPKPKSTRRKLFNRIEKAGDVSPLDKFGFT